MVGMHLELLRKMVLWLVSHSTIPLLPLNLLAIHQFLTTSPSFHSPPFLFSNPNKPQDQKNSLLTNTFPNSVLNIAISWVSPDDDDRILAVARNTINRGNAIAATMNLSFPYIYQNYAAQEQDVFSSYGAENKKKLQEIHEKYDPHGVWTVLQPGYFKIWG